MIDPREWTQLTTLDRDDVLSVSLDIDPTKPEHQTPNPAYRIWLHRAVHDLVERVPEAGREEARRTAHRILSRVDETPPRGRGLALFAGPDLWREYPLPIPLPNRVRYGRPDLMGLLWASAEYSPYAILIVARDHARIAVAYLGGVAIVDDQVLHLDPSDWRFKSGRVRTAARLSGISAGRGTQRDAFDARIDAEHRKFWHEVAGSATRDLSERGIDRLILAGPDEATSAVRAALPAPLRNRIVGTIGLAATAPVEEITRRTLPLALADRHRHEGALVADVLAGGPAGDRGVAGRAATLEALMSGDVRVLVAARDVEGTVWECHACGYVAAVEAERCPMCNGTFQGAALAQVLPVFARRHGATLELIGPQESGRLAEGLGGVLRHPRLARPA